MICLTMIMYFAVIASIPFTHNDCKSYIHWDPNSAEVSSAEYIWILYEFQEYLYALYVTTVVSLVGWVS